MGCGRAVQATAGIHLDHFDRRPVGIPELERGDHVDGRLPLQEGDQRATRRASGPTGQATCSPGAQRFSTAVRIVSSPVSAAIPCRR